MTKLIFIHLSDIHFRHKKSGTTFDLDEDLRNELELDAERLASSFEKIDGILITGDIAFAGKRSEYDIAWAWLDKLARLVNCDLSNVWMVPGNHDVDRSYFESGTLKDIHAKIRNCETIIEIDEAIREVLEDQVTRGAIFGPVTEYNNFAAKFGCGFDPKAPFCWESTHFKLNDGSSLILRGLNSTLISDDADDDKANKLVLGTIQSTLKRSHGIEYITMCHHPPQWLLDYDNVEDKLNNRVKVQLFGHKHSQKVISIGESVRVTAGAVHPERREPGWLPRYNFLELWVDGLRDHRILNLNVYPRVWDGDEFTPEVVSGKAFRDYRMPLSNWIMPEKCGAAETIRVVEQKRELPGAEVEEHQHMETNVDSTRVLAYRFLSLPFYRRFQILADIDLIEEGDQDLTDRELFETLFRRANERHKLIELWDQVEKAHGDSKYTINPFK